MAGLSLSLISLRRTWLDVDVASAISLVAPLSRQAARPRVEKDEITFEIAPNPPKNHLPWKLLPIEQEIVVGREQRGI